ncbi:MAG: hypothetical protein EU541_06080 [Promethearchaeota archaeon]|nr:MAG: hypothetical protein EU541_06080 [Candidatus Lokiarchaeota archaeon]
MNELIDLLNPRILFQKLKQKDKNIESFKRIYHRVIKRLLFRRIYFERNNDIKKSIIIAGGGRSGTTWLAEVLAEYFHYRLIFEPLHPNIHYFKPIHDTRYIPPSSSHLNYKDKLYKLFSGELKHQKLDLDNRIFRPKGRIVKFIRANLLIPWMKTQFPNIPIVFILRHPCAVISSRINLGWEVETFNHYLGNKDLMEHYLNPYKDIITNAESPVQKQACNWCIENLVPLKAMKNKKWIITTYEDLVMSFKNEIKRIIQQISPKTSINENAIINYRSFQTPNKSKSLEPLELLSVWKSRLTSHEINDILTIVKKFSLDNVYDNHPFSKKYSHHSSKV